MVLVRRENYILVVDLKMKSMMIIDEIFDMVKIPRNNFHQNLEMVKLQK